ncbi:MAG: hypothetical protein KDI30_01240, partial [Pseudomonadales bacterium]|nr:hypothetical protein [Pseudomonadales bacterium]
MPVKRYQVDCPHAALKKQWSFLAEQQLSSLSFVLDYDLVAYYQQPQVIIPLTVFCCLYSDGRSRCMVTTRERFGDIDFLSRSVDESAMLLEEAAFDLNLPLMLEPVHIPKPWGQEIWFTGIEARGQASICSASGKTLLPYVLPLFQPIDQLSSPVLLKVLDPSSEPVYGDLYFELHTRKQEVYVVTHVDHQAWPKGEGAIRFGFCKKKRSLYASDEDFKAAYLEAVQSYRAVRQQIDVYYDELKLSTGLPLNEPVPLETLKAWAETLPVETQTLERQLREEMHSFTGMQSLAVGDVLAVPCLVPHALQHGVRTVEFQTPVYERKILSFAQKVLTQSDWDTGEALSLCDIHLPAI